MQICRRQITEKKRKGKGKAGEKQGKLRKNSDKVAEKYWNINGKVAEKQRKSDERVAKNQWKISGKVAEIQRKSSVAEKQGKSSNKKKLPTPKSCL